MKAERYHFDRLMLGYVGGIFAITFVGSYYGLFYLIAALMHVVMIIVLLRITGISAQAGPRDWLRWLYPLLLFMPLHYEIELVATLFHSGAIYDELVKNWDSWLFRGSPHRYLADRLPGPIWRELFHFFYFTYYFIVVGGFWYAWRRGRPATKHPNPRVSPEFLRYAFVFLGTFCTYMFIFILFPVVGPLDDRFLRFYDQGLLGPLIDLLYSAGDSAGGAFPSSHVGEALVVYILLRPRSAWHRSIFLVIIAGLTISTVYGAFHYAIDTLGGLVTGPLFYLFWDWVYRRLPAEIVGASATAVPPEPQTSQD